MPNFETLDQRGFRIGESHESKAGTTTGANGSDDRPVFCHQRFHLGCLGSVFPCADPLAPQPA
jgi:hypothetical protein